ncbi:flagellar filament capping protein FliD [Halomonas salifodinae]|uniref:flagellar filament capping protein FliD n=1 Tax=Halomonas salifodinae TaxID=438745 RepID=UPI0033BE9EE3
MATISSLGIGSGLDLNGLLDQLRDAERGKLEPIKAQQAQQQAKISAYGQLQSALTTFQDSVAKLNDASLFQSLSTNVRGDAFTATAGKTAQPGTFNVEVSQLASAGTLATQRVSEADSPLVDADTTLELTFAGLDDQEPPQNIKVEVEIAAGSSLEDIRDAINAQDDSGVSASIVNDGSGYRLALSSTETGEAASIASTNFHDILSTDAKDDVASFADNQVITQAGEDALIKVNGIDIVSSSNRVEGAIQGVTLNLEETTAEGQTQTLRVEQDTLKVREAINGFVKAFNDLKGTIGKLTAYNGDSGAAGELIGDNAVRTIESRLRGVLGGGVGEGELRMLSEVGITLQRDGTLKLDSDDLDELITGNMAALGEFFAGADKAGGLAGQMDKTLGQLLDSNGIIKRSIEGAEGRAESLVERHTRMEQSINRTIERYRVQFGQLDAMIAQMNQTSQYLTQQFDALDAQLGRRK